MPLVDAFMASDPGRFGCIAAAGHGSPPLLSFQ